MRRLIGIAVLALTMAAVAPSAWAGSPHFITLSITRSGNSLIVTGKEAGLGNEPQIHVILSASAACINPGDNHPQAANKTSVSAEGDFPVQNGKADFTLTLTPTFKPDCTPPMTLVFSDVAVKDATSNISQSFPGTF
jgi:hypothetical protein